VAVLNLVAGKVAWFVEKVEVVEDEPAPEEEEPSDLLGGG
jgi:hypothetical protein